MTLDGEVVVGLDADIGYVHTGFEKNFEQKTYWKAIPYSPRMDYVAFFANELAYVGAVEKLIGIEVPERAQWIRTLFAELNRIHSHLIYLGTSGVEMGAMSVFFYCLRERDAVLDLFEMATGVRMHDRYPQFGGVAEDLPQGLLRRVPQVLREMMPKRIDEYLDLLAGNPVWKSRYQGIGTISAETAIAMGLSGPTCARPGRRRPAPGGAVPRLRQGRLRGHHRRAGRCLRALPVPGEGDVRVGADHRAVPRQDAVRPRDGDRPQVRAAAPAELHTSMESLIHHFKLVTEGFRVEPGQVYYPVGFAAPASSAATSSPTAARSRGGRTSARRASSACR